MVDTRCASPLAALGRSIRRAAADGAPGRGAVLRAAQHPRRRRTAPAAARIAPVLGGPLPTTPCTARRYDTRDVLWLGPDEWLIDRRARRRRSRGRAAAPRSATTTARSPTSRPSGPCCRCRGRARPRCWPTDARSTCIRRWRRPVPVCRPCSRAPASRSSCAMTVRPDSLYTSGHPLPTISLTGWSTRAPSYSELDDDRRPSDSLLATLPGSYYTDESMFALEQQQIFEQLWFCVVRSG